jgi:hypothetical protein
LRTFCETPDGQLQVGAARARDGKLAAYSRNSDHPLARRTQRHSCSHASDGHAGQWHINAGTDRVAVCKAADSLELTSQTKLADARFGS